MYSFDSFQANKFLIKQLPHTVTVGFRESTILKKRLIKETP